MPKGPFYYWSKNGTGANAWIQMLKDHYTILSATYLQRGMKKEAELFANVAEEFALIQQEVLEQEARKTPSQ